MEGKTGLRVKEAVRFALLSGKNITSMDVAVALWGDSKEETQRVNISNLSRGKTKRFEIGWIEKICKLTGVDANFLFGLKDMEGIDEVV